MDSKSRFRTEAAEHESCADARHGMPMPSPELAAMFAKTDELMKGMSPEEVLQAARELYYDADRNPQLRQRRIQLVTD